MLRFVPDGKRDEMGGAEMPTVVEMLVFDAKEVPVAAPQNLEDRQHQRIHLRVPQD
jgi:hypothetical protein